MESCSALREQGNGIRCSGAWEFLREIELFPDHPILANTFHGCKAGYVSERAATDSPGNVHLGHFESVEHDSDHHANDSKNDGRLDKLFFERLLSERLMIDLIEHVPIPLSANNRVGSHRDVRVTSRKRDSRHLGKMFWSDSNPYFDGKRRKIVWVEAVTAVTEH
jgi:hypothetical protein